MRNLYLALIALIGIFIFPAISLGQLPQSNFVYMNFLNIPHTYESDSLYNFDPSQPVSATNPSVNIIMLPSHNSGLAISSVLGSNDPTLTFYTTVNQTFWYYSPITNVWINTGDSIGEATAVNIGAGGGYIYTLRAGGFFPTVYKYDGTGNAVYVANVQSPLPYDLLVDCAGNFYVISNIGPAWGMTKYSPNGDILQGYTVNNTSNWVPSGGMAAIGNRIYTDRLLEADFVYATVSGTNVTFDSLSANMPFMVSGYCVGDMANVANSFNDILPNITIATTDTLLCNGATATFTSNVANGGNTPQYQWFVNGIAQTGATGSTFTYQPANGDTVTAQIAGQGTCPGITAISQAIIIHTTSPVVTINYNGGPFCLSTGIISPTLTGTGGGTYSSSGGLAIDSATGEINTAASQPGTYIVTYNVGAGSPCSASTMDTVIITAPPAPPVMDISYCVGAATTALMPVGNNYQWYTSAGSTTPLDSIVPSATVAGSIIYYVSQTVNGCESQRAAVTVTVSIPTSVFTTSKNPLCAGDTVLLSYAGANSAQLTYMWQTPGGDKTGDSSGSPLYVQYTQAGTYIITLQVDSNGCIGSPYQLTVTATPPPSAFFILPDNSCQGDTSAIHISYDPSLSYVWTSADAMIVEGAAGNQYGVIWNNTGADSVTLQTIENGCYSLPYTTGTYVYSSPAVQLSVADTNACNGDVVNVAIQSSDTDSLLWLPGNYSVISSVNNMAEIRIRQQGYITVKAVNNYNCSTTDSIYIQSHSCCLISIPTAFTPNNDGANDYFRPVNNGRYTIQSFIIKNRWGQTVYQSFDDKKGWNGVFNGELQETGTYFYYITYKCIDRNEEYHDSGDFTLVR